MNHNILKDRLSYNWVRLRITGYILTCGVGSDYSWVIEGSSLQAVILDHTAIAEEQGFRCESIPNSVTNALVLF